jgi:chemotaxis protein methyltransferase CheR
MTQRLPHVAVPPAPSEAELGAIARVLYEQAGIVLAPGKTSMVQSRLGKRLRALGLKDYGGYIKLITSDEGHEERRSMISALTTNVTQFFRENHHFETLRTTALPPLIEQARAGGKVRIWSAGCSTGQEVFSIAMVLADMVPELSRLDIKLLATDIDPQMIARGRAAVYEDGTLSTIPKTLQRFTSVKEDGVHINQELRNLVSFHELNLHDTWPMRGLFDIVFCRNVVIYFNPEDQLRLWRRFESVLKPGGWLFVGHSERIPLDPPSRLTTAGITTYKLPAAEGPIGGPKWH